MGDAELIFPKKEFKLSDKIDVSCPLCPNENIKVQDVKEFIRLLKEEFSSCSDMPNTTKEEVRVLDYVMEYIDKLAGDKLCN